LDLDVGSRWSAFKQGDATGPKGGLLKDSEIFGKGLKVSLLRRRARHGWSID